MEDARFQALVDFTLGRPVECGDHSWVPVANGVVAYRYRDREPVELDILEAALAAGRTVQHQALLAGLWD